MDTICQNCGAPADSVEDLCHGCNNVVCLECSTAGGHIAGGQHWIAPKGKRYMVIFDLPLTKRECDVMIRAAMEVSGMQVARKLRRAKRNRG